MPRYQVRVVIEQHDSESKTIVPCEVPSDGNLAVFETHQLAYLYAETMMQSDIHHECAERARKLI